MSHFELIDDYLSNRLKGAEREAFEKQLNNDPALRSDLDFQKQIVEGIRNARTAELKEMLNQVPVGGTSVPMEFSVVRMAAGVVAAGVVGAAIYFYVTRGELPPFDNAAGDLNKKTTEEIKKDDPARQDEAPAVKDEDKQDKDEKEETKKESLKPAAKKTEEAKPVEKPKLDVTNPSEELDQPSDPKNDEPVSSNRRSDISPSTIQVDLDSSSKKYDFHYQFVGSKLMLYGSFDRSLYEILELNGDNHAVFLFYKDAYYLLDQNQTKVTKLEPIKDAALVNKLREYRKR